MDLIQFLQSLVASDLAHVALTAVAIGAIVFGAVEYFGNLFNLSGDVKFISSLVLAVVLPFASYLGLQALKSEAVDWNGLFLAAAVAWIVSQGIHRVKQSKEA